MIKVRKKTYSDGVKAGYEKGRKFALSMIDDQINMLERALLDELGGDNNAIWAVHTFASDLQGFINVIKR